MATVNKDFRVKHGLVVEGTTATVNSSNVLTEASTEFLQDTTAAMFTNGAASGITFTYNDSTGTIDAAVSTTPTFDDKITFEGTTPDSYETILQVTEPTQDNTLTLPNATGTLAMTSDITSAINALTTSDIEEGTNLYYTAERVQDEINDTLTAGAGIGLTYTDNGSSDGTLQISNTGVTEVAGTTNQIAASGATGNVTLSLPSTVVFPGSVTLNADPSTDLQAATKQYVDAKVNGLTWKQSANLLSTTNVPLTGTAGTLVIDGHAALDSGDIGYRIVLTNQTTPTEDGIYVYNEAAGSYTLTRSSDADVYTELIGASIFINEGTSYGKTSWVQSSHYLTSFDNQVWTQVSGQGTYVAGNGLTLTGNSFSIDTTITVDVSTSQTLSNKTLTNPSISGLYLSDNNIVIEGTPDTFETTLTFTNPTADRTITFKDETGTVALTSDVPTSTDGLSEGSTNLYFTDERAQDAIATAFSNGTQTNITVTYNDSSNSLSLTGASQYTDEMARDAISTALVAGSGIGISVNDGADSITISNAGVISVTGTTDQISTTGSSGDITLSLPQNIATTSTPTFSGVNVSSVTLADALMGTAIQSISDTSATVVDTWSASTYRTAKYVVQLVNGADVEVIEVLVTIDGNNNVYLTEYADVQSNTQLGTTDADYSSGNVRLLVTSTNGTNVKVHKTLIEA